jgi:glycosyltransferase involved in cell wall biosynthesis
MNKARTIYFYRKFNRFTGGHLKVWDYFNHIKMAGDYLPFIYLEPGGDVSENNPFQSLKQYQLHEWIPSSADLLFIGGSDWLSLPFPERQNWPNPIINLIQGFRHSIPDTPLYDCLSNHAIRICVSQEVANSILATGKVNGPVYTIPNGIEISQINDLYQKDYKKDIDLLIVGLKNPKVAIELEALCNKLSIKVVCLLKPIPRIEFIKAMVDSNITVFLPEVTEGFYLPALEGMAAGTFVICPDCIGNRSYCYNMHNSRIPEYSTQKIFEGVDNTLNMSIFSRNQILQNAIQTINKHSIENERSAFNSILKKLDSLWIQGPSV